MGVIVFSDEAESASESEEGAPHAAAPETVSTMDTLLDASTCSPCSKAVSMLPMQPSNHIRPCNQSSSAERLQSAPVGVVQDQQFLSEKLHHTADSSDSENLKKIESPVVQLSSAGSTTSHQAHFASAHSVFSGASLPRANQAVWQKHLAQSDCLPTSPQFQLHAINSMKATQQLATPLVSYGGVQPATPLVSHRVVQPATPLLSHRVVQPATPVVSHREVQSSPAASPMGSITAAVVSAGRGMSAVAMGPRTPVKAYTTVMCDQPPQNGKQLQKF